MGFYYSTQPAIAWILNHHFYGRRHFVWAATPFHPYRQLNPKSSNPYLMYADLYQPWRDDDRFDRFVTSMRLSLIKGVIAMSDSLGDSRANELIELCNDCPVEVFLPIVYRLDVSAIDSQRRDVDSGSATGGSREILIRDLDEDEFDILFANDHESTLLAEVMDPTADAESVLRLLQEACL